MAGSRRGRSRSAFSSSELRGTLGSLIRNTLAQAGVVRDVIERGAREGRARLDDVRIERQRTDALAELGEAVLDAIRRGDLADLEELPEIAHAVEAIEELEARLEHDAPRRPHRDEVITGARGARPRDRDDAPWQRGRDDRGDTPWQSVRDHRDVIEDAEETDAPRRAAPAHGRDSDGTVSSSSWKPPRPAAPPRVWRPSVEAIEPGASTAVERGPKKRGATGKAEKPESRADARPEARPDARPDARPEAKAEARSDAKAEARSKRGGSRGGGISFEDDSAADDLQDYMHPDDVPPRAERERDKK